MTFKELKAQIRLTFVYWAIPKLIRILPDGEDATYICLLHFHNMLEGLKTYHERKRADG